MNQEALDFYAAPGRFTTLDDGEFCSDDIQTVVDVVQGLLVYDVVAQPFYGVEQAPTSGPAGSRTTGWPSTGPGATAGGRWSMRSSTRPGAR